MAPCRVAGLDKGNALARVPRLAWNHLPSNADAVETGTDPKAVYDLLRRCGHGEPLFWGKSAQRHIYGASSACTSVPTPQKIANKFLEFVIKRCGKNIPINVKAASHAVSGRCAGVHFWVADKKMGIAKVILGLFRWRPGQSK